MADQRAGAVIGAATVPCSADVAAAARYRRRRSVAETYQHGPTWEGHILQSAFEQICMVALLARGENELGTPPGRKRQPRRARPYFCLGAEQLGVRLCSLPAKSLKHEVELALPPWPLSQPSCRLGERMIRSEL